MESFAYLYIVMNREIIKLSVLDGMNTRLNEITTMQVDSKVAELREAIGVEFSDNNSSTLRSVLLSVSIDGNTCTTAEVASPYKSGNQDPKPGSFKQPSYLVWTAMFY